MNKKTAPNFSFIDKLCIAMNHGLSACFSAPSSSRARPDAKLSPVDLTDNQRKHSAALMRVNHSGEVCAQALYQGQAFTARDPALQQTLRHSAEEENDHLNWCAHRLTQLESHSSYLNPLWYSGSLFLGMAVGCLGDGWSLGFLAETEKQVCRHLDKHLTKLPEADEPSRAILQQMHIDENKHAEVAIECGAYPLPTAAKQAMTLFSKAMTGSSYYL